MTEIAMNEQRKFLESVLIRDEARPCRDCNKHAAQSHVVPQIEELHPSVHLEIMGADMTVLLLHITFYIR